MHQVDAAVGQRGGVRVWFRLGQRIEISQALQAQQPKRLLAWGTGQELEIAAAVQNGSCSERIQHVLCVVAARIEQSAAVVIANAQRDAASAEQQQSLQHAFEGTIELRRNCDSVEPCQNPGMQEHIQRINVIVRRIVRSRIRRPAPASQLHG